MALPSYDVVAGRLSAVTHAQSRARDLADPQKVFAKLALWDLVIDFVLDAVNGEDAGVGLGVLGDDSLVRFDLRRDVAAERRVLARRRLSLSLGILRFSLNWRS